MAESHSLASDRGPLVDLDEWETVFDPPEADDGSGPPSDGGKTFRDYRGNVRDGVREFYRHNHTYQTLDFVRAKKREYLPRTKRVMGIWEAMEFLNSLIDD